ncbi:Leucine-rich repeat-containing protein 57 [Pseudolycoriella hygida]|uniref:Leucine-rich repeat-containing protein 57 n=1 Tax=Pseudolycoriella hygida TaxID=35572 RepID=A0A9Q0MIJ8_9DIPT|nr:Leucine-rich repeat-containing protein 57 [Pseudolycoriella hygida]
MGNKAVKQHFETAQKTGVLKISQQRLQEFPPHLRTFPNVLRTLDISENRFVTIPDKIGDFTLLKHLNLNHNRLVELPDALGRLTKLESLNAINNLIARVPTQLANLINLKQVHLSNNQITEFPIMLCGLKHLDILELSKNKITSIPSDVKDLQVTELNVNQNQISALAEELADCPKLKILRIEENCLPITAIHSRILKESKISNIYLDGNMFQSKQFVDLDGYEEYMERYTAVKKKMF